MFKLPCTNPLENLEACQATINDIIIYKNNNWAIGQLYPSGGPDSFTYFFTIRCILIANYLRGTISIGEPTAYDVNIKRLKKYMNMMIAHETEEVEAAIRKIYCYKAKNWAIGEAYPDGGPDFFVYFFGVRNLQVVPYLVGTVTIGTPAAYDKNIEILTNYLEIVKSFKQTY